MIEIKDNDISFIKKKECYLFFILLRNGVVLVRE